MTQNNKEMESKKLEVVKHTKEYEKGYREGLKDAKEFALMTKKEKYESRKNEIRREVVDELRDKFKEIFGFITQEDLNDAIDKHYEYEHKSN